MLLGGSFYGENKLNFSVKILYFATERDHENTDTKCVS